MLALLCLWTPDANKQGWWSGEDPSGNAGLFPSNYVELQEHDSSSIPAVPLSTSHHEEHEQEPESEEVKHAGDETAIAEYDYEAQEDNELSFPEGARITNIERVDDNWWAGEYNGQEGLFPCTFPFPSPFSSISFPLHLFPYLFYLLLFVLRMFKRLRTPRLRLPLFFFLPSIRG